MRARAGPQTPAPTMRMFKDGGDVVIFAIVALMYEDVS
jgi:hypothetical protein